MPRTLNQITGTVANVALRVFDADECFERAPARTPDRRGKKGKENSFPHPASVHAILARQPNSTGGFRSESISTQSTQTPCAQGFCVKPHNAPKNPIPPCLRSITRARRPRAVRSLAGHRRGSPPRGRPGLDPQAAHPLHVAEQPGLDQDPPQRRSSAANRGGGRRINRREIDPHDAVLHHLAVGPDQQDLAGIPRRATLGRLLLSHDSHVEAAPMMPLHRHGHVAAVVEQLPIDGRQFAGIEAGDRAKRCDVRAEEGHETFGAAHRIGTIRRRSDRARHPPVAPAGTARSSRNSSTSRSRGIPQAATASPANCRCLAAIRVALDVTPARS